MEKKNTILLTVIAVATLLVAVVGATFAYYSVGTTLNTGTTKYTATTGPIGSIAQTLTNTNLSLKITPEDMLKLESYTEGKGKSFWAVNNASEHSEKYYSDSEQDYDIVNVTLSNGDEKTKYTCTGTIEVKTGSSDTMVEKAQDGDLKLYLKVKKNAKIGSNGEESPSGNEVTLDLSTLKSLENKTQTYKVIYEVSGKDGTSNISTISAALELVNREADQKELAGKTLAIEITTPTFDCDIDTTPAS